MTEPRITAWSYSRYRDYKTCPRKAKYKHVDHLKEPSSPAAERGIAVHKEAEDYLNGVTKVNPFAEMGVWGKFLDQLRQRKGMLAEARWTFTRDWTTTDWRSKDAWLRMGIDAHFFKRDTVLTIVDFKTGKVRDENQMQLSLYALGAFELWPKLKRVETEFWYLDSLNEEVVVHFDKGEHKAIKEYWEGASYPMLHDEDFPARPGFHCRWCAFSKANGGPCEF